MAQRWLQAGRETLREQEARQRFEASLARSRRFRHPSLIREEAGIGLGGVHTRASQPVTSARVDRADMQTAIPTVAHIAEQRFRFRTGDVRVDACLLRLEALANKPSTEIETGASLEDWIEDVLREMRVLPHDLLRRLKPEWLYCWDSPRKWSADRSVIWHAKASAVLRQALAEVVDPSLSGMALPRALSSSMGVTHSYRHYLREGLVAMYQQALDPPPSTMLEQVGRFAAARDQAPLSNPASETSSDRRSLV